LLPNVKEVIDAPEYPQKFVSRLHASKTLSLLQCCRTPHPSLWCCSSPSSSQHDPLTWIVSLFLAADLACTLARQSGTRCQMNLESLTVLMALNDSWNDSFQLLLVWPAH